MTGHILTTWLLTYAVHGALFVALAAVAERTRWGAVPSRRDAFWKLALVGGILTSTVFVAAGSAPAGAAVHLSPQGVIAPALASRGVFWLATGWMAITAILALRTACAWRVSVRHAGRRRIIRQGPARVLLDEILGPAAGRVTLSCSRTLRVPVAFAREICLPVRALRELPNDELHALLAHEAAHVVRRDAAWLMIAAAVRALGWWQPFNLLAAGRLRLAMELCCDERAAPEPPQRAALARCLIKVAEWNLLDDGVVLARMASRGSALRTRLESLLDDAPHRRGRVGPWVAVTTAALPVLCLAPVVTIAGVARVPAAAVRLVTQAQAPEARVAAPAARAAKSADARRASRMSTTAAPPLPTEAQSAKAGPSAAATDRPAVPEIPLDEPPPAATPEAMPSSVGLEPVAASSTPLRDAVAAARITPGPAPSPTRFDEPGLQRRVLNWVRGQHVILSSDPQRPNYELR